MSKKGDTSTQAKGGGRYVTKGASKTAKAPAAKKPVKVASLAAGGGKASSGSAKAIEGTVKKFPNALKRLADR